MSVLLSALMTYDLLYRAHSGTECIDREVAEIGLDQSSWRLYIYYWPIQLVYMEVIGEMK